MKKLKALDRKINEQTRGGETSMPIFLNAADYQDILEELMLSFRESNLGLPTTNCDLPYQNFLYRGHWLCFKPLAVNLISEGIVNEKETKPY